MLVSVHIPKCAGMSFHNVLRDIYRERCWTNYGRIFSREQARSGVVPQGTLCIHGHFMADAFDDIFPRRELVTWVRHPVERVASMYHFFLRNPGMRDDSCRALHERKLGLREFADLDGVANLSSRLLAGKPVGDFAFVGIVETFPESLCRFARKYSRGKTPIEPKTNVNSQREDPGYPLSREDIDHILSRNESDLLWYEQARARFGP